MDTVRVRGGIVCILLEYVFILESRVVVVRSSSSTSSMHTMHISCM